MEQVDNELVQSAVFSLFSPREKHSRLHIAVTLAERNKYFPNVMDTSFVVAVEPRYRSIPRNGRHCACVNVFVVDCDLSRQSEAGNDSLVPSTNILTLFCTEEFLVQFCFTVEEVYRVQIVKPPPLKKITLSTDNGEVFSWASSHIFSTGILINVCNQHNVIACTGAKFALPYSTLFEQDSGFHSSFLTELQVIETEPFFQGAVTVNTELLVIYNTGSQMANSYSERSQAVVEVKKPVAVHVSDFSVPVTSLFISRQINKPTLYRDSCNIICLERDWNILDFNLLHALKHPPPLSSTDHTIYADMPTLMRFCLFNDSLVEIELEIKPSSSAAPQANQVMATGNKAPQINPTKKQHCVRRVVKFKLIQPKHVNHEKQNGLNVEGLFMPCGLLYNLQREHRKYPTQDTCIKFRKYQPDVEYLTSASRSWNGHLPYAREVYVSCVYSPEYSTGTSYNTVLQKYFSTPKTVQKDDVFAVDTSIDVEFSQDSEAGSITYPIVYFVVKRITPRMKHKYQTYFVDSDHSALYQHSPCHSYIPSCLAGLPGSNNITVPGLAHHVSKLTKLLQPYLDKWCQSLETVPAILLHGNSGCGKSSVCQAVATACNMHYFKVNCYDLCGETSSATETKILQTFMRACLYSPCVLQLHNIQALGKDRDGNSEDARVTSYFHECIEKILHKESPDWPVIVMATTSSLRSLTSDMHAGFLHTFEIEVPDESARRAILESLLNDIPHLTSLSLDKITQRTAGFVLGDLAILVAEANKEAYKNVLTSCFPSTVSPNLHDEYIVSVCGPVLQKTDFDTALNKMQAAHSDAIGAPKIPNVTWDDVGGLAGVKADILDTLQLPLQHPELFTSGLHRSGVLLFGPPGTGKTLLAKAVATECSLNFLSVKGPELINMYVGQSEENIREVFSRARNAAPCVIFFDELDSLAPNRGRSGDSGGVMDRVVSQLLAELDGLHKSCDVFVIGATNRPDLLDPALLRPGRFDKLLYLGVSEDKATQLNIIKALTRKFTLAPSCDLSRIVEQCPGNMTGADFYALSSDAMLHGLKRQIDKLETGIDVSDENVEVSESDFYEALNALVPSVSEMEIEHYKQLQNMLTVRK